MPAVPVVDPIEGCAYGGFYVVVARTEHVIHVQIVRKLIVIHKLSM